MSVSDAFYILLYAAETLTAQVCVQLIVGHSYKQRGRKIPRESLFLVSLFAGVPVFLIPVHENLYLTVLSCSLGLAYVMGFNPASGIRSPSFRILGFLIEKGRSPKSDLLAVVSQDSILERKIAELTNDQWIQVQNERAILSQNARTLIRTLQTFRKALNIGEISG